jgi:L-lactate utilization protein LutB
MERLKVEKLVHSTSQKRSDAMSDRKQKLGEVRRKLITLYRECAELRKLPEQMRTSKQKELDRKFEEVSDQYGDIMVAAVYLTLCPREMQPAVYAQIVVALETDKLLSLLHPH